MPMPFAAWHAPAWLAELLPSPPLTRNQTGTPGFGELDISPHGIEDILPEILRDH
jgi:hypothetical protein